MATSQTTLKDVKTSKTDGDDIAAQISTIKQDLADLTKLMKDVGEQRADDLKSKAARGYSDAKARGQEGVDHLRAQAESLTAEAERFTHDKPTTALAIAAGIGFLFGLYSTRR